MAEQCSNITDLPLCKIDASYIRPDSGVAILPCLFSIPLFITQCVSLFIRLQFNWRNSQFISYVLAIIAMALTIVAYKSTGLDPESIFIWTPVSLIVDVGTIIHLIAYSIKDEPFSLPGWMRRTGDGAQDGMAGHPGREMNDIDNVNPGPVNPAPNAQQPRKWTTAVFCFGFLCLLFLIVLQFIGLVYAFHPREHSAQLEQL